MNSLYLIDGHSYLYRAYHAIPYLSNSKGLPTNAIYGFTNMLTRIIREKDPAYLAVAFDSEKPTHRHAVYEAYKAHRPQMPEALAVQVPYVRRVVEAFRIPVLVQEGVEADDLIGTVAKRAEAEGVEVMIVSGDKDMFQLVSPRIRLYDSMRDRVYGEREVRERFGAEPWQVVEIMGLMGDPVDNIPGVPGVGEKTAAELIRQFGSIDNLLAHLDEVKKPKIRESLQAATDQIRLSRELARLDLAVPWKGEVGQLKRREPDTEVLYKFFTEMEFSILLKGLTVPVQTGEADHRAEQESPAPCPSATPDFIQRARQAGCLGVVGIFPPTDLIGSQMRGIALSCAPGTVAFATIGPESLPTVKALLEDTEIKKVGHDLKPLFRLLAPMGVRLKGAHFDTMLASYLLASHRRTHDLPGLGVEYLGRPIQDPNKASGPTEVIQGTACKSAGDILEMSGVMKARLEERGQSQLFQEVELPLIQVLADMEHHGFRIDPERLGLLSKELDLQLQGLVERIYRLADGEFNLNSPKQLSEVLFQRLGLKPVKRTKTGYSTDEGVLSQLARAHELPAEILNYRQLAKLKSTYVDALPQMVNPRTGRLHTTFHQTVTATGRLSSSDPNLQNIPIRGEWGRRIRQAFIAEEGHSLLSSDYNQIELRILAHLSQDPNLMKAFQEGRDIHTETASSIFKLPTPLITPEMRRAAKTVNFGIIYGMGPFALSAELGTSQAEARQYIENYFDHYQGVRGFVEATLQEARRLGYVTTLLKRRREIPEVMAENATARSMGERMAINTLIQGSAADLMKLAMVRIFDQLDRERLKSRMILQIHDELIFEAPQEEVEALKTVVRERMEGVIPLSIPIRVDVGVGPSWAEIH